VIEKAVSTFSRHALNGRFPPSFPLAIAALSSPVTDRYDALVREQALQRDPAQVAIARRLDRLAVALGETALARKSSPLGWIFSRNRPEPAPIRGVYIHGGVGRGKTMLMDLFHAQVAETRRRRAHFHAFMADIHERIFAFRQQVKAGTVKDSDPIPVVAGAIADEARLLCFDEFAVTDIADAMILGRLFTALFGQGVTVVATSNVAPQDLYRDGLNRALFLPFIAMLEKHLEVLHLDAATDYRLEKLTGAPIYHIPADARARAALGEAFRKLTGGAAGGPAALAVKGRNVDVPLQAMGVARFDFGELCERPLGAVDYLAVAQAYHTLLIDGIPVFDDDRRNEAKRFITLIDILYENRVKLIVSAAAEPDALHVGRLGAEAFEFARTASRLIEMRSADYLALPHGGDQTQASGDTTGLVET
jgi:cell division protein ZapE